MSSYRTKLNIDGMTCEHCVKAVQGALEGVMGVDSVDVNLEAGSATVDGAADVQSMLNAVEAEGYNASLNTQTPL